ncbi:toxin-antitoxin system HicB family antitoxin [Pelagicoccus mobilis]|uniref:Toxin-antitoxin system HicB family antitoxin n=1 Tax=Pelagicoccus mobilis TaxID=415221 RepID=A0A934RY41_9BACT|nr:DUF6290 family protein [Pelagicoccus mobilis]MBK1875673.1 toxin-antitoxin system HicB family antitoxin [Pelagicoccus mobilis]
MSAITIRLPESLHRKLKEVAKRDGISLNQFISSAASEKLSAVLTLEYLQERADRGSDKAFREILGKVRDRPPLESDPLD